MQSATSLLGLPGFEILLEIGGAQKKAESTSSSGSRTQCAARRSLCARSCNAPHSLADGTWTWWSNTTLAPPGSPTHCSRCFTASSSQCLTTVGPRPHTWLSSSSLSTVPVLWWVPMSHFASGGGEKEHWAIGWPVPAWPGEPGIRGGWSDICMRLYFCTLPCPRTDDERGAMSKKVTRPHNHT